MQSECPPLQSSLLLKSLIGDAHEDARDGRFDDVWEKEEEVVANGAAGKKVLTSENAPLLFHAVQPGKSWAETAVAAPSLPPL